MVCVGASSQSHLRSQAPDKNIGVATTGSSDSWQAKSPDGSLLVKVYQESQETQRSDQKFNRLDNSMKKLETIVGRLEGKLDTIITSSTKRKRMDNSPETKGAAAEIMITDKATEKVEQNRNNAASGASGADGDNENNEDEEDEEDEEGEEGEEGEEDEEEAAATKAATEKEQNKKSGGGGGSASGASGAFGADGDNEDNKDDENEEEAVAKKADTAAAEITAATKAEEVTEKTEQIKLEIEKNAESQAKLASKNMEATAAIAVKAKEVKEIAENKLNEIRAEVDATTTALAKANAQAIEAGNNAEAEALVTLSEQELVDLKIHCLEKEKTYQIDQVNTENAPTKEQRAALILAQEENTDCKNMIEEAEKNLQRTVEASNEVASHGIEATQQATDREKEKTTHEASMVARIKSEGQAAQAAVESNSVQILSDAKDAILEAQDVVVAAKGEKTRLKNIFYIAQLAYDAASTSTSQGEADQEKQALDIARIELGKAEATLAKAEIKLVQKSSELFDDERLFEDEEVAAEALLAEAIKKIEVLEASAKTHAAELQGITNLEQERNKEKEVEAELEIVTSWQQHLEEENQEDGLVQAAQATIEFLSTKLETLKAHKKTGMAATAEAIVEAENKEEDKQIADVKETIELLGQKAEATIHNATEEDSTEDKEEEEAVTNMAKKLENSTKSNEKNEKKEEKIAPPTTSIVQGLKSYIGSWFDSRGKTYA